MDFVYSSIHMWFHLSSIFFLNIIGFFFFPIFYFVLKDWGMFPFYLKCEVPSKFSIDDQVFLATTKKKTNSDQVMYFN